MYAGRIVEFGRVEDIFAHPSHPYTQSLLGTIPSTSMLKHERLPQIAGLPPDMRRPIVGCAFKERCGAAHEHCQTEAPQLTPRGLDHVAACWAPDGLGGGELKASGSARTNKPFEPDGSVVVELNALWKEFKTSSKTVVRAVNGVNLRVHRGETLGIVGESGCGKSTVARLLLGLEKPTSGDIFVSGLAQMVFQDPASSFNPKMTIGDIVAEPLAVKERGSRAERSAVVRRLIDQVGLDPAFGDRYPHQLSGGQRQRVAVARALALNPSVVVADEPTSALDVSVRAQIINLLVDLKQELGISFVFISHDLLTVRYISDRIAVMYLGEVVEYGAAEEVFADPRHPYTKALIDAVPVPDPAVESRRSTAPLQGELPSPLNLPKGCAFASRCPIATDRCRVEKPTLPSHQLTRQVACHYVH
jgi:peptide/nickel transport system ATP-binding protein